MDILKEGEMVTESSGAKRTKVEVRLDLLDPNFILAMAYIMKVGADKYGDFNWQQGLTGANSGVNHALKHLMEYQSNTPCDYGPRRIHLAQVAVNAMFEFYFDLKSEKDFSKGVIATDSISEALAKATGVK